MQNLNLLFLVFSFVVFENRTFASAPKDFVIKQVSFAEAEKMRSAITEDCRENISKVVCLVDPQEGDGPRECLAGGENYAVYFERAYDNVPAALQRMFCSLKYLYIERKLEATGYAGVVTSPSGEVLGALMGVRQSVLDQGIDMSLWASWKEQLTFGGVKDSYTLTEGLPTFEVRANANVNDFIYQFTVHEFGHIFDFANNLNRTLNCREIPGDHECDLAEGTFGSISWATSTRAKPENDFSLRSLLCFYWCEDHPLSRSQISEVYSNLARTDFINTYAATNPWDDFADSLAYYMLHNNLGAKAVLHTGQGEAYDINEKLLSPLFAKKYEYIERFLSRTDIAYP